MTQTTIATASGETTTENLGRTLMHEHLVIGYPGWESHTKVGTLSPEDELAICVDKIQEIQAPSNGTCLKPQAVSLVAGGTTVVLGDNSQLANEFGTQIFCNNYSTIYKGNQAYFKFTLTAGKKYTFTLKPKYKNARFYIFRGSCKPHDINQDCGSGGKTGLVSANSYSGNTITSAFTPTTSGTYHLAVDSTYTGTAGFFTLEVK